MRWKGIGEGTTEDDHKVCECSDDMIEDFYEDLEKLLKTIPRKDILVVQGDWNAKIGTDAYETWKRTTGKFGFGETNKRGQKLLERKKRNKRNLSAAELAEYRTTNRKIVEIKRKPANVIEDSKGKLLTKVDETTKRWKEYCEELYNYEIEKDLQVLGESVQVDDMREEILLSEVEIAIKELKKGKAPGVDNIQAELLQSDGEVTAKVLQKLCNTIAEAKKWPK
ncbi:uncharacterized protein LOC134765796 [Penaeus indicus]|uniref:uncharacterized protein LOC134765796 n=1 Tax=Penaeus indicus TaxID=29960 RepID=UPI00300C5BEF